MIIRICYESIVCIIHIACFVAKQNNDIWDSEHMKKKDDIE